jgi:energy-coupling factor transporter transmembrane protein EcfT
MSIHWVRVVLGALLLEIVLFAVLVPISFVSTTLFLIAVPIGCFVLGYLVTRWLLRSISSGLLLHGVLVGIVATAMYFGLVFMQPEGLSSAIAVYGAPLFWFSQAMRIAGCVTGALHSGRRAGARSTTAAPERV